MPVIQLPKRDDNQETVIRLKKEALVKKELPASSEQPASSEIFLIHRVRSSVVSQRKVNERRAQSTTNCVSS